MTVIEAIASLFGLLCVWLTVRRNIWCGPVGLVMVSLYIWIVYQAGKQTRGFQNLKESEGKSWTRSDQPFASVAESDTGWHEKVTQQRMDKLNRQTAE